MKQHSNCAGCWLTCVATASVCVPPWCAKVMQAVGAHPACTSCWVPRQAPSHNRHAARAVINNRLSSRHAKLNCKELLSSQAAEASCFQ